MILNGRLLIPSCLVVVGAVIACISCGGGGGGSSSTVISGNRPPVASSPSCSNIVPAFTPATVSQIAHGDSRIWVPPTSVARASDVGTRAHTNYLVLASSRVSRDSAPSGLTPTQVAGAYGLSTPPSGGAGAIAIVDANDYPNALSDFNTFSAAFNLPTEPSTNPTASTNAVFQVVYAAGTQPGLDAGWAQEMALDTQWAHALAPAAKIYLVEAASTNFADILAAINIAKTLPGVRQVSISFTVPESGCSYVQDDSALLQTGVTFFCAGGDSGGERDFPALSMNVIDVGGTTLNVNASGAYVSESVWNSTGCGPSLYEPRPVFQDALYSTIGKYRGGCDIAAVADPNTGVSVYDSIPYGGSSGWFVAGGTSAATPIIAGIVNSAGKVISSSQVLNTALYAQKGSSYFHAITTGSSGGFSAGTPWCFPTGLGTPNGIATIINNITP